MKFQTLLCFALLAVASAARVRWYEVNDLSFEDFAKKFGRDYSPGSAEWSLRKMYFEAAKARVLAHNADPKQTWKRTINHLSDRSDTEKKALNGHVRQPLKHAYKNALAPNFEVRSPDSLPASVDWRSQGVISAVKDQGQCGSCWAFASTETIESHVALASGRLPVLSPQQLLDCVQNPHHCGGSGGCNGGTAELVYDYVKQAGGIAEEWTYSYRSFWGQNEACHFNNTNKAGGTPAVAVVDGYVKLPTNDYNSVMTALATVGPLSVAVAAGDWSDYDGGVYTGCNSTTTTIDHAVQLVGYGTDSATGLDYWLIRNTWSTSWGENGFIRIQRFSNEKMCGTDYDPSQGSGCDNGPSTVLVCGACGVLSDVTYPIARPL